ncbi:MAG: phosphate ABC transporter, permease protein PstA, partial [Gammaproteobacteria bacterium]
MGTIKKWYRSGESAIWLSGTAVAASITIVFGLLILIAVNGLSHFWPTQVAEFQYQLDDEKSQVLVGEVRDQELIATRRVAESGTWLAQPDEESPQRLLIKTGNRELYGLDFRWLVAGNITRIEHPANLVVLERLEWGNYYGYLQRVTTADGVVTEGESARAVMEASIAAALEIREKIVDLEKVEIGRINYAMEKLRLRERGLELEQRLDQRAQQQLDDERAELDARYKVLQSELADLYTRVNSDQLLLVDASGRESEISVGHVVRAYYPNSFSFAEKIGFYAAKAWEFVSDDPREANTEGGIFPAIFGTVVMVLVMSVLVTPFGVLAAVYLREYARQGIVTRIVRIAVNNLAGVPSIVYGVFGLGFFVYFLGGNIDQLFFPEALPAPTFGTPGLLWSSLTLALLT